MQFGGGFGGGFGNFGGFSGSPSGGTIGLFPHEMPDNDGFFDDLFDKGKSAVGEIGETIGGEIADAGEGVFDSVTDWIGGWFGGDEYDVRNDGPCSGQPTAQQVQIILDHMSERERRRLIDLWNVNNGTAFPEHDVDVIGSLAKGGYNCKIQDSAERNLANFVRQMVAKYVGGSYAEAREDESFWDRVKEEAAEMVDDLKDDAAEEVSEAVGNVTEPIVQEKVAEETISDLQDQIVPLALGAAAFALLKGAIT